MTGTIEVRDNDRRFYEERIAPFLPSRIIDCHSHVWAREHLLPPHAATASRSAAWAANVAEVNPIEQHLETYAALFPMSRVTPVIFPAIETNIDRAANNAYVREESARRGLPALALTTPDLSAEDFERLIDEGGFRGCKPYLNFAPGYIPANEIRIFDFLPRAHLDVLDRRGWVAMLHIPRPGRLGDPVNLAELAIIDREYPNARVIVTHVGRAYSLDDLGNSMAEMAASEHLLFDITANTNSEVMARLIEAVGPERIMFGSDLPIFGMRAHRVVEGSQYVNVVPRGLYPVEPGDPTMRETDDASEITFLIYEEIDAFRRAAEAHGLTAADIEAVFGLTAASVFDIALS